jgi:hypothetical protein
MMASECICGDNEGILWFQGIVLEFLMILIVLVMFLSSRDLSISYTKDSKTDDAGGLDSIFPV